MSEPARIRRSQDASAGEGRAPPDDLKGGLDQVLRLFTGERSGAEPAVPSDEDWSASLAIVRGVAAKVRDVHRSAQGMVREAQRTTREAEAAVRAAEEKARQAESAARDAVARAELAEERTWAAEERADAADARAVEARAWLKRMHDCMVAEFGALSGGDAHDG